MEINKRNYDDELRNVAWFFDREIELARKLKGEAAMLVQKIKTEMINVSMACKQALPSALVGSW